MSEHEVSAEPVEATAIEAIETASINQQIATARRYPRDVSSFLKRARTMIGEDPVLAGKCGYSVERGGKVLTGASVRLAEIALVAWGNARLQVVEEPYIPNRDRVVRCHAMFHDLESNVAIRIPKVRRTVNREGRPFNDDMMAVTQNANISVAYRDAILRGVPRHFINDLYSYAMRVAAGDVQDLPTARKKFLAAFKEVGVPEDRLLRALGLDGPESITLEHLGAMRAVFDAIKRGETTADRAFPEDAAEPAATAAAAADAVMKGRGKGKSEKAPAAPTGTQGSPEVPTGPQGSVPPKVEAPKKAEPKPETPKPAAGEVVAGDV